MDNRSLIKDIFIQKQKEKSEDRDNLLKLISRSLYGEAIHYALELIQNAEDEDSSCIEFIFDKDQAIVINDGRPFDKEDVWGICSVKTGRKKRKIGFFGIGFKAVFNITKTPQIISGKFNFELHDFIYPKALTSIPKLAKNHYTTSKGSIFVLPYHPELPSPDKLIESFSQIDEKLLLFLESVQRLEFSDLINRNKWTIQKKPEAESAFSIDGEEAKYSTVSLTNSLTGETKWKVFHRDLPVKDINIVPQGKEGIKNTRITIAFLLNAEIRDKIKKGGVVYCYLPTKKRTDLPFLIQADFLPTIGRENISEDPLSGGSWNTWLMHELGILAGNAINELKHEEAVGRAIYDFIPMEDEIQDELIKHLYKSLFETLQQKDIAKTTKGWLTPKNCAIPNNDALRELLIEPDLHVLFHPGVSYADAALSEKENFTRAEKVLFELGAIIIRLDEIVAFLGNEKYLNNKKEPWFLNLYDYLRGEFDIAQKNNWKEDLKALFAKLESTKFILTDKKELIPLRMPDRHDRLICYPQSIALDEIHDLFTEGEIIFLNRFFQESGITHRKEDSAETEQKRKAVKEWFDSIGVKKSFKQVNIILEVILPKFLSGKYQEYDDLKIFNLLNYIRTYWSTIQSEIQNKRFSSDIIEEIKDAVMIKAYSYKEGNILNEYKRPRDVYFSRRYGKNEFMEDLFEGIESIYFVSPYYLNRESREAKKKKRGRQKAEYTWVKFFEIIGVWSSPRVVKDEEPLSINGRGDFKWIKTEWSPQFVHEIHGNSNSDNIKKLIEYCGAISGNPDLFRARMTLLWESLEKNWKFYKDNGFCTSRYEWLYHSKHPRIYSTSSFLEYLREAHWVPTKGGNFLEPNNVFVDSPKNNLLLGESVDYVELKANETFLKDLRVRIEPEIDEVMSHLKSFKETNPLPAASRIEKFSTIYSFLRNKLELIGAEEDDGEELRQKKRDEIVKSFDDFSLVYLPREDKAWWKPRHVFWDDYSECFGPLRGYVQHNGTSLYDDTIKTFLFTLGVIERPSVIECLEFLHDLKSKGDAEYYKRFTNKTYSLINTILKQKPNNPADWNYPIFLSSKGQFQCPSKLYYCDNEEYEKLFSGNVEIIWLPFHWENIKEMLNGGGFRRLSESVTVIKKLGTLSVIEGDSLSQLDLRLLAVKNYLRKKKYELFISLQKSEAFARIEKLQAFDTPRIIIDFVLNSGNKEPVTVNDIEKDAYYSVEENRLYKSSEAQLFSTSVARELSKLFSPAEDEVFSLLDSLFGATDEEELNRKLGHFGIQDIVTEEKPPEIIKIIPPGKEESRPKEQVEKGELQPKPQPVQKPRPPEVREMEVKRYDLIDPNDFKFEEDIEEHTPYVKIDGPSNLPTKTVKLVPGRSPDSKDRDYKPRPRVNRSDSHAVGLELAMRFEEVEGREPENRESQKGIGYDIYSKGKDNEELFIDVKGLRWESGSWELTSAEWKKAEEEKEKYFVYVVSRIGRDTGPIIEIIQNPVKYLFPDPPVKKSFSDWKNAVTKVVKSQKV